MIHVTGHLLVDSAQRDRLVELSRDAVRQARATTGCLDFAVSADSVEPDRVNISERWTGREALDAFRGDGPGEDLSSMIREAHVQEFTVPHESDGAGG